MSVTVEYPGRFGNNLFQYIFARLFAARNGLKVVTPFNHENFVSMAPQQGGFEADRGRITEIGDGEWSLDNRWAPGRFLIKGYFQRSEIYWANKPEIETFAKPVGPAVVQPSEDLVVNFRIDSDYRDHLAIHPTWYADILARESYRRLYVVSDLNDEAFFQRAMPGHKYEVFRGSPREQWDFLRGFERIVMSNSTFCWWAVFFGRAKKAFIFKRWIDNGNVHLTKFPGAVVTEGRFLYEEAKTFPKAGSSGAGKPKIIMINKALDIRDVQDALKKAAPPYSYLNVSIHQNSTYVHLPASEMRDPTKDILEAHGREEIRKKIILGPAHLGMKRNLCFYIYPKNRAAWRWHVKRLQDFWSTFNGRKLVIVATDETTESVETVAQQFADPAVQYIRVNNDPQLWETKHFINAIDFLKSTAEDEATFYAHAKGVIHNEEQLKRVRVWCDAMYVVNLERPELVDRLLARYAAIGCFKHELSPTHWFFPGTFFWFKHSDLFTKEWKDIGGDRFAVENYLCRHIASKDAHSLTPYLGGGDLYGNPPEEPIFRQWLNQNLVTEGLIKP
jgi:hypothetical protein